MQRMTQHQLAIALLRWSQVQRSSVVQHWQGLAASKAAADALAAARATSIDDAASDKPLKETEEPLAKAGSGGFRY